MATLAYEIVEYMPQLRRYARALTRNAEMADDLVQDCLERALERLDQFEAGTNMRAWLFKIMHSIFVNHSRKHARRGKEVELAEWRDGNHAEAAQDARLEVRDFQRIFATLPEDHQTVLLLIGVEGFSYEEAAGILDVPTGTVRSRLSRARQMLLQKQTAKADSQRVARFGAGAYSGGRACAVPTAQPC